MPGFSTGFSTEGTGEKLTPFPIGGGSVVDTDTDDQGAAEVPYDNGGSGLASTDVQNAIDELAAQIAGISDGSDGGGSADDSEVLLDSQTVSGVAAITWNGPPIPTTGYRKLRIEFCGTSSFAGNAASVNCRANNDSGANYDQVMQQVNNSTQQANSNTGLTSIIAGLTVGSTGTAGKVGMSKWEWVNFLTSEHKSCTCEGHVIPTTTGSAMFTRSGYALWRNAAPITRIDLFCNSGGNLSGVAKLYAVK